MSKSILKNKNVVVLIKQYKWPNYLIYFDKTQKNDDINTYTS